MEKSNNLKVKKHFSRTPSEEVLIVFFVVDYAKAGKGYIDINVKNKNQAIRHSIHQLEDGACLCTFYPKEVGQYKVDISFNGVTLPGKD